VSEQLSAPVPGWTEGRGQEPHRLSGVTLYDGKPEERASLVGTERPLSKREERVTWSFAKDREYWLGMTLRIYEQFLGAVVESRKLPEGKVREVADGRVMTGQDAKALGLIDELGNFYAAVDLAKKEAHLTGEPTLVYPPEEGAKLFERLMGGTASAVARSVKAEVQREAAEASAPGLYLLSR
jgi:hypothetical protein